MATTKKIRSLTRLLDSAQSPFWVIAADGQLVFLSAAAGAWLKLDCGALLGRRCVAGTPVSQDPLDQIAASLSPPPGIAESGTASLRVQPPTHTKDSGDVERITHLDVRFVRLGYGEHLLTLAVGGVFNDRNLNEDIEDAAALRHQLDMWRKRHQRIATLAASGDSASARRLRAQLHVAASVRTDIGVYAPSGSASKSIASHIHRQVASGEPVAFVDGPLMDPELLEASMATLINQLTNVNDSTVTVVVLELDEMPINTQHRLLELLQTFDTRLRLIGLCHDSSFNDQDHTLHGAIQVEGADQTSFQQQERRLYSHLAERMSGLSIRIAPLASRVEDIPVMASGILGMLHAKDKTMVGSDVAARLSRGAIDALVQYPWPNNFDELVDSLRVAIGNCRQATIHSENLPLAIRSYKPGKVDEKISRTPVSLDRLLSEYEHRMIEQSLEATGGNRAAAARRLGISRARLLRRLDDQRSSGSAEEEAP